MASTGTVIFGADYNTVQVKAEGILGSGSYYGGPSNGYGYGQSVASSTVTPTSLITAAQWDNLVEDLNKSYLHQNGSNFTGYSTLLTNISNTNPITYDNLAIMSDVGSSIVTNRLTANAGQLTLTTGSDQYINEDWGGILSTDAPATISNSTEFTQTNGVDGLHNFFNAGGSIRFIGISNLSLYTETDQENAWVALVNAFDVTINYTTWQTIFSNAGTLQTLYSASSTTTPYTGATITFRGVYTPVSQKLTFTLTFADGHSAIGAGPDVIRSGLVGFRSDVSAASGSFSVPITKTTYSWLAG